MLKRKTSFNPYQPFKIGTIIPTIQMSKWRLREGERLALCVAAGTKTPGLLGLRAELEPSTPPGSLLTDALTSLAILGPSHLITAKNFVLTWKEDSVKLR